MSTKPWYHKGLRFQCGGCGNCCTGAPGYVWVNQEEIATLATALGIEPDEFVENYTRQAGGDTSLVEFANGDCVFFDNAGRRCTVYLHRPRQCRTWPFWESNLADEADWARAARNCPGIGKGPLVPLAAIEALLRVIGV